MDFLYFFLYCTEKSDRRLDAITIFQYLIFVFLYFSFDYLTLLNI